jgi:amino acid adenylation domain-containing protein
VSVDELLHIIEQRGIELGFEGTRLRFRAPKDAMDAEIRAELSKQRPEIVVKLRALASETIWHFPASFSQRALWFLHQQAPNSTAYSGALSVRVRSTIDRIALGNAFQAIVDRHEVLRSAYIAEDGITQRVHGSLNVKVNFEDSHKLNKEQLREKVIADFARPFDLDRAPLARMSLYTVAENDHVLLLTVHHIAADGWSLLLLFRELVQSYAEELSGSQAFLPPIKTKFSDYVRWQDEFLKSSEGESLWSYWNQKLSALPAPIDVTDRPRPREKSFRGASVRISFASGVSEEIRQFARQLETTVFVVLLATFQVFLAKLGNTDDVIVGTPVFARARPEFLSVVGDFVNTVAIRGKPLPELGFAEFVTQLRSTVLEAIDAQEYPLTLLVQRLRPSRDTSRSPLFDTFFSIQQFDEFHDLETLLVGDEEAPSVDISGLSFSPFPFSQQEGQFDLALQLTERDGQLFGAIKYDTQLFDEAAANEIAARYRRFAEELIANPGAPFSQLGQPTPAERAQILEWGTGEVVSIANETVAQLFEQKVNEFPDRVAVTFGDQSISYERLNERANQLARRLRDMGAVPGAVIGICLDRSIDLIVALIAVLKSGAAYLPLDPDFPAERLSFMLKDSAAKVVLSSGGNIGGLEFSEDVECYDLDDQSAKLSLLDKANLDRIGQNADPAYIIYTSGSTGQPKGVVLPHSALVNFLTSMQQRPGLTDVDVLAAVTTVSFDISGLEIYLPLIVGARVDLIARDTSSDGFALANRLKTSKATLMQATPATWRLLLAANWQPEPRFRALCGGEALPPDIADALLGRVEELWNLYGPTETTIWSTVGIVEPSPAPITVGSPIANTQIYLLNEHGLPVSVGTPGELWIGGAGVAIGYHGRSELTAERFIVDPFSSKPGARMYRTGDLARWDRSGRIHHLGRSDQQVKVRGFRIELEEVERALASYPAIRQACVATAGSDADVALVAYYIEDGSAPTTSELRRYLRSKLPNYMIPALFVNVVEVPLTPSGKVDRKRLPDPFRSGMRTDISAEPLASGAEQQLADVWRGFLQTEGIGPGDNFFELGGHSLLSMEVAREFQRRTGIKLDARAMFFQSLREVVQGASRKAEG